MPNTSLVISDILFQKKEELAKAIVLAHWSKHPELEHVLGGAGQLKCEEDARYHLDFLSASLYVSSPFLFQSYLGWARDLLAQYGLTKAALVDFMDTFQDVLFDTLADEDAQLVKRYIDQGVMGLSDPSLFAESYIDQNSPLKSLIDPYFEALLSGDRHEAVRLSLEAIEEGLPLETFYVKVLQPVQCEMGRLWQLGKINVAQEHMCTAITQFVMAQLYSCIFQPKEPTHSLVATCVGDESHEVGLRMVTDLCELAGWQTFYLGGKTPHKSIVDTLIHHKAQILCISATIGSHLRHVSELIAEVRRSDACQQVRILVGGQPFNMDKELWKTVGADAYAPDAEQAVVVVNQLVEEV